MREGIASEGDTLMHAGHGFAMLPAFRCAVRQLGMLALHFRQGFLFLVEKARVGDLAAIRGGSERLQPERWNSLHVQYEATGALKTASTGCWMVPFRKMLLVFVRVMLITM